jgi:hypothetical protein
MMRPRWAERQILRSEINIFRAAGRSAQAILRNARAAGPIRPVDSSAKGVTTRPGGILRYSSFLRSSAMINAPFPCTGEECSPSFRQEAAVGPAATSQHVQPLVHY